MNKIIFVLSTKGRDVYSEMTRIAISSLRLTNPQAQILIYCDEFSYVCLKSANNKLFTEADGIIKINTGISDPMIANRYIKTRLGSIIEGPFLFLDSDILVRKELNYIFSLDGDIALSVNHSQESLYQQIWSEDINELKTLGWNISNQYFNGGVIYYSGSIESKEFAKCWHENWLTNLRITGRKRDQPSLNYSINKIKNLKVSSLPISFNHQLVRNKKHLEDAHIWHFYADKELNGTTKFEKLTKELLRDKSLNIKSVEALINAKTPNSRILQAKYKLQKKITSINLKFKIGI